MTKTPRFTASEKSLNRSHSLAKRMGLTFNREKVAIDADNYLDRYFDDICITLPNETQNTVFQNFASRDLAAVADVQQHIRIIEIDQQWSFFLFNASTLLVIWASVGGTDDERSQWLALYRESLNVFVDPHQHESFREKMRPYLLDDQNPNGHHYERQILLANLITAAIFSSLICHELAHHELNHLDVPESHKIELEADALGYEFFCKIINAFGRLKALKVPPHMHGAPLILMEFIRSMEVIGMLPSSTTHPSAQRRIDNLTPLFNQYATEDSQQIYTGLKSSIDEINSELLKSQSR